MTNNQFCVRSSHKIFGVVIVFFLLYWLVNSSLLLDLLFNFLSHSLVFNPQPNLYWTKQFTHAQQYDVIDIMHLFCSFFFVLIFNDFISLWSHLYWDGFVFTEIYLFSFAELCFGSFVYLLRTDKISPSSFSPLSCSRACILNHIFIEIHGIFNLNIAPMNKPPNHQANRSYIYNQCTVCSFNCCCRFGWRYWLILLLLLFFSN